MIVSIKSSLTNWLFCLALSLLALPAFSQNTNTQNPNMDLGDTEFEMDTVFSVLPIREDDKMYQVGVWRRIDLREKFNLPLYGTGGLKSDGIMMNIYNAIVNENAFEIFADEEFTQPLSISEFQTNFLTAENGDSTFVKDIYYLDFREDFVFDKHRSEVKFDVKYLELVMPSETNSGAGQKSIAFIRFKDFYEYFDDMEKGQWLNFQNTSKHLPYSQAFDLRLFRSVVRKYTNPDNALIVDMIDPNNPNAQLQAFLNSLEFEYDLLEWENNLWEW
ncbi:type IX secretion system ring subunit PorN/GldN [Cyclobacterium xiamenense]|jgi:gliding motility associated protien GldN|uniref:type IX secretion system ring protein PorN/GldN n=1 Tax=Cyclobacterium xiamenense TaxID=1297121 RepID=UPI0012B8B645|nr:gliding motility protein GldN [Cyclobacterium xiamenense]